MSKPIDRATVASMKKAVVRYKRSNLNQSKMRKPQLQSTLRALGVQLPARVHPNTWLLRMMKTKSNWR